jgi:hypothetical protein
MSSNMLRPLTAARRTSAPASSISDLALDKEALRSTKVRDPSWPTSWSVLLIERTVGSAPQDAAEQEPRSQCETGADYRVLLNV